MPVYMFAEDMPHEEFVAWQHYFKRWPVGWREDDRTYKIMEAASAFGGGLKMKPWEVFPSLDIIYRPNKEADDRKAQSLKGSTLFHMMLGAKGGDQIDVD